jgi:hypothetical protein
MKLGFLGPVSPKLKRKPKSFSVAHVWIDIFRWGEEMSGHLQ